MIKNNKKLNKTNWKYETIYYIKMIIYIWVYCVPQHTVPTQLEEPGTKKQAGLLVTEQPVVHDVPSQLKIVLMTTQSVSVTMKSRVRPQRPIQTHITWWGEERLTRRRETSFTKYLMRKWSTLWQWALSPGARGTWDIFVSLSRKKKFIFEKEKQKYYKIINKNHLTQRPNYSSNIMIRILNYRLY